MRHLFTAVLMTLVLFSACAQSKPTASTDLRDQRRLEFTINGLQTSLSMSQVSLKKSLTNSGRWDIH